MTTADALNKNDKFERSWWSENWDKVLSIFLSLIVGAVGGFLSAIFSLSDKIGNVENRILVMETQKKEVWDQRFRDVENTSQNVNKINQTIDNLDRKVSAHEILKLQLEQMKEQDRKEIISEFRKILEESRVTQKR
jgi:hypothetical protein